MTEKAYVLVTCGAVTWAIYRTAVKKQLPQWQNRVAAYTSIVTLTSAILLLIWGWLVEENKGDRGMWMPIIVSGVFNIGIQYFDIKSKDLGEVSLVTPIAAGTPTIVILTSFLILGERVSRLGWIGIMLTAVGAYTLTIQDYLGKRRDGSPGWRDYLAPFFSLSKDKGVQCAMVCVLLGSIAINYDGLVARRAPNIGIGYGMVFLITGIGNALIAVRLREWRGPAYDKISRGMLFEVLAAGVIFAVTIWLVSAPLQWALVPYIATMKRLQIPITIVLAYFLLKEKTSFKGRLAGGIMMATGAMLIGIS